ncbi:NAD(P)-binding domain-containing protein [Fulvivirgaceae bacterium BMA12]|uniref:NAD(P)-binding domain-containing protein n=1 Tax=Agaribacillus aureus TaxID=3051825 RepID=A0ABT8L5M7_9BACT|nr:NAD(P)-binding domain-containing protein [Fulvivirgaceae bacterium BMA12]
MKIAIIGAGNVGGALARNWAAAGHEVYLGVKNPADNKEWSGIANLTVCSVKAAADEAAVLLVALPVPALVPVAQELGNMENKIVIDATNAVFAKPAPYETGYHVFKALTGADVIKSFNTTGFENMANPVYHGKGIDMFMAAGSQKAKEVVRLLASDAGFEACYDFGGEDKVLLIEQFAMAWINLAILQKEGRDIAFKVLRR